jgi:hypothetical protein
MPALHIVDGTDKSSRVLINAGWDDVPHLSTDAKGELLAETPQWLREARSKGIPSLGVGAIYPIPRDKIEIENFIIPRHWPRCYALDVGWNWTAVLWCAFDRESMTKYLYACYKAGEELPAVHAQAIKARGEWIPGLIDPAANNRSPRDGERIMADYVTAGLNLTKANNAVEAGLVGCWQDLSIGRIRVFKHGMDPFWFEYGLYHRDEKGKIVKKNDHLMDDMRYIHNSGAEVWCVQPADLPFATQPSLPTPRGGY